MGYPKPSYSPSSGIRQESIAGSIAPTDRAVQWWTHPLRVVHIRPENSQSTSDFPAGRWCNDSRALIQTWFASFILLADAARRSNDYGSFLAGQRHSRRRLPSWQILAPYVRQWLSPNGHPFLGPHVSVRLNAKSGQSRPRKDRASVTSDRRRLGIRSGANRSVPMMEPTHPSCPEIRRVFRGRSGASSKISTAL